MKYGHEGGTIRDSGMQPTSIFHEGDHSIPGKALVYSSSSSFASETSLDDLLELDANAVSMLPVELIQNNGIGPLELDSKQTLLAVEPGHWSKVDSDLMACSARSLGEADSFPRKSSSRSSSSSSASESPSLDSFQLGIDVTRKSPEGATSLPKFDEDNEIRPLETESNQAILVMEPENGSSTNSDLGMHPGTAIGEADLSTPTKQLEPLLSLSLSMSSSSSELSTEDPFEISAKATSKSPAGTVGPPSLSKDTQLSSNHSNKDIPASSMPNHEQSSHGLAGQPTAQVVSGCSTELGITNKSSTQFLPVQVMERPGDPASSQNRIPSYVFARTKSTVPMEWSTTSNESLFSIHTGNMSFTKEQFNWLVKSGELVMAGPLMDISNNHSPTNKSTENSPKKATLDEVSGVTETKAAKTMREIITENEAHSSKDIQSLVEDASHSPRLSHRSDQGTKSFAFPILSGDVDKGCSPKVGLHGKYRESGSQPQTPKETSSVAETSKAPPNAQNRWFSCFSCCSI
ncbi:hypothetical protein SO802_020939 [Lithocarpus litseifolius]|uniref:Uncharacterized protein n=1 Tax=Lithocarpus litseifolius TaxID=425828 RepID=A0AAW2CF01_9ROSI